jgi:hypothetical protein
MHIHCSALPPTRSDGGAAVSNAGACFSFVRMIDISAGHVAAISNAHLGERALLELLINAHATMNNHIIGSTDSDDGLGVDADADVNRCRVRESRLRMTSRMLLVREHRCALLDANDNAMHLDLRQVASIVKVMTTRAIAPPIRAVVSTWHQSSDGLHHGSGMDWDAALSCT